MRDVLGKRLIWWSWARGWQLTRFGKHYVMGG